MKNLPAQPVAYFCAEYAFSRDLPTYAGGLGVLAGDTILEMARQQKPCVALGLLYRGEEARQFITLDGKQEEQDIGYDPRAVGLEPVMLNDAPLFIKVHMTQVDVWIKVWQKSFGPQTIVYFLDTETEHNHILERNITHQLYTGTPEADLKQQLILGVGGVKLLAALGITPSVYHLNEGRPIFAVWQLIRQYMDLHGSEYQVAWEWVKQQVVYTNHTLVAAGNTGTNADLVKAFGRYYADKMQISIEQLLEPGLVEDSFSSTLYAIAASRKSSGVSQLHSRLSAEQWPHAEWASITNGVFLPRWQDATIASLCKTGDEINKEQLWQQHQLLKKETADFVLQRTGFSYDHESCVVAWARRIAGYKQLDQVLSDVERLKILFASADRPMTLLVSGKAHYQDTAAKEMIASMISLFSNELSGHALFIPDYDVEVAQFLTRGVDVWLNTPIFGKEASGTSGMKAISNGVLQVTVADGWAAEVDWTDVGWVLDHTAVASSVYDTLSQVQSLYYSTRNQQQYVEEWLNMMCNSIRLCHTFSTERMVNEYFTHLYAK